MPKSLPATGLLRQTFNSTGSKMRHGDYVAKLAGFAAAAHLIRELQDFLDDPHTEDAEIPEGDYLSVRMYDLRWHVGAIFGMDPLHGITPGLQLTHEQHFAEAQEVISLFKEEFSKLRM